MDGARAGGISGRNGTSELGRAESVEGVGSGYGAGGGSSGGGLSGDLGRSGPSSDPSPTDGSLRHASLPGCEMLTPVLFGPLAGRLVPPIARGTPITSRLSSVEYKLGGGFVEITAKGQPGEEAFFQAAPSAVAVFWC